MECSSELPAEVVVDAQRVKQVLMNLISNSLKFTMKGEIRVILSHFWKENNELFIKMSVADTGIGIRQEDKAKLFQLFGKIENTASKNTSGIGLGLSICKKIVTAFGGTIFLDESPLSGTCFTFTIKC